MNTVSPAQLIDQDKTAPANELERTSGRTRLVDVDHAKGFAIALVVWGHLAGSTTPLAPLWFYISVSVIYSFHMPFFMYLSGYVFFVIGGHERFLREPARYTAQRFSRLMIPFLGFAGVVVVGKYFAAQFGPTDHEVTSISRGFYDVITNGPNNPCLAVWFLLCLFIYCIISPLLWRAGRNSMAVILLVGCAGWIFAVPEEFYAERIAQFFIFFGIGGLVAVHRALLVPFMKRAVLLTAPLFAISCYVMLGSAYAELVCGIAAIPALHGVFLQKFADKGKVFLYLGSYSLTIYLMNTIAIGVYKLFYARMFSFDGIYFYLFLAETFLFGLLMPIVAYKIIERLPGSAYVTRFLR